MADQTHVLPTPRAREIAAEIRALRQARDCVTSGADDAVIYGRIDSLIFEREGQLASTYRSQQEQAEGEGAQS